MEQHILQWWAMINLASYAYTYAELAVPVDQLEAALDKIQVGSAAGNDLQLVRQHVCRVFELCC
jgi:hypothetical protein